MRISDWSSDVCSSDLASSIIDLHDGRKVANEWAGATPPTTQGDAFMATDQKTLVVHPGDIIKGTTKDSRGGHFFMVRQRSEERRGGKESVSTIRDRCCREHYKKKKHKKPIKQV